MMSLHILQIGALKVIVSSILLNVYSVWLGIWRRHNSWLICASFDHHSVDFLIVKCAHFCIFVILAHQHMIMTISIDGNENFVNVTSESNYNSRQA